MGITQAISRSGRRSGKPGVWSRGRRGLLVRVLDGLEECSLNQEREGWVVRGGCVWKPAKSSLPPL